MLFSNLKNQGFTLVEMLLSIAIIGVIFGFSLPLYQSLQNKNNLELASDLTIDNFRLARTMAISQASNSAWGLYASTSDLFIFQGNSFNTRLVDSDVVSHLPDGVRVSGTIEFIFERLSGSPQATGTLILINSFGQQKIITINERGLPIR